MEEVVPEVFEFLHFVDTFELRKSSRRIRSIINNLYALNGTYKSLTVHGLESSEIEADIALSDFLLSGKSSVSSFLFEDNSFGESESVVLFNFDESRDFFRSLLLPGLQSVVSMELHNVTCIESLSCIPSGIETLKMGLNLTRNQSESIPGLDLPNLKILEVRGIELSDTCTIRWLADTLSSISSLVFLRLSFQSHPKHVLPEVLELGAWNASHLLSLEIMTTTDTSLSDRERELFVKVSSALLKSIGLLPKLQTFTMNCAPSESMWELLSTSPSLMHLVVTNCDKPIDLKLLAKLIQTNCMHLQILILKFAGKTNIHLDSLIQIILSASSKTGTKSDYVLPPLERLELEVVMDETSGLMDTPFHTIKAASTLRCRYRDHMYFHRWKYGIALAAERAYCTDIDLDYTSFQSPMELFREEMVKDMMSEADSGALEAAMINEWNSIGPIARAIYVEIYDWIIDRYLRGSDDYSDTIPGSSSVGHSHKEDLCDVAATIANLRE